VAAIVVANGNLELQALYLAIEIPVKLPTVHCDD